VSTTIVYPDGGYAPASTFGTALAFSLACSDAK